MKKGILAILIADLIFILLLYYFPKSTFFITFGITGCFIKEALKKGA